MQSAITPANVIEAFWLGWESDNPMFNYYTCMYFSEIESELAENQSREMSLYLNGRFWSDISSPAYLNTSTYRLTATNAQKYKISLKETDYSSLPPILNALEIYQEIEFLQLLTNQQGGILFLKISLLFIYFFLFLVLVILVLLFVVVFVSDGSDLANIVILFLASLCM